MRKSITIAAVATAAIILSLLPAAPSSAAVPATNTFPIQGRDVSVCANSFGAPRSGGRTHMGDDCFAPAGTPLLAVENGTIAESGNDGGLGGIRIWLQGDSGTWYYYAHNSVNYVPRGVRVGRSQVIAAVGNTGNAATTPSHVHFEIHPGARGAAAVNPYPYLAQWSVGLPLGNGSVIARDNGNGTYLEAVLAGGHAFPLTQQDKAVLGLGPARIIPTQTFDGFYNAPISSGTVIAKSFGNGQWMEAIMAGGQAFVLSQQDKVAIGLGSATGIPAAAFDWLTAHPIAGGTVIAKSFGNGQWMEAIMAGGQAFVLSQQDKAAMGLGDAAPVPAWAFDWYAANPIASGTVIAKSFGNGQWMESIMAGGHAFLLSQQDKSWLGLGYATPVPASAFDWYMSAPIAERTVIARRNPDNTYLEAYIVNGRAVWVSNEDKVRLGLGPATVIPTAAFNSLL